MAGGWVKIFESLHVWKCLHLLITGVGLICDSILEIIALRALTAVSLDRVLAYSVVVQKSKVISNFLSFVKVVPLLQKLAPSSLCRS